MKFLGVTKSTILELFSKFYARNVFFMITITNRKIKGIKKFVE